jgi:hypothetical protein
MFFWGVPEMVVPPNHQFFVGFVNETHIKRTTPTGPNSYCCEDKEKMATAGSTIPRALAQRGCLGQHIIPSGKLT